MPRVYEEKTNFSSGEISENMLGRSGIKAHNTGMKKLRNVKIENSGAISNRPGSDIISYHKRAIHKIICFDLENIAVTVFFSDKGIKIRESPVGYLFEHDKELEWMESPYTKEMLQKLAYVKASGAILLISPYTIPCVLERFSDGQWLFNNWSFPRNEKGLSCVPLNRFWDTSLEISGLSGEVIITSKFPIFDKGYLGTFLLLRNKVEADVLEVIDEYRIKVKLSTELEGSTTIGNEEWLEHSFSGARGWPSFAGLYQGRLILGGAAQQPNYIWFSQVGEHFNFDVGVAEDSSAFDLWIDSRYGVSVYNIHSGDTLLLYGNVGIWEIVGHPITPTTAHANHYSGIGSYNDCYVPVTMLNNLQLFIGANGGLYQNSFSLNQRYDTFELSALSSHLLNDPEDIVVDDNDNYVYLLNGDGTIAVLFYYKELDSIGWSLWETYGKYVSISKNSKGVFLIVERDGTYFFEKFSAMNTLDAQVVTQNITTKGDKHTILNSQNLLYNVDVIDSNQKFIENLDTIIENTSINGMEYKIKVIHMSSLRDFEEYIFCGKRFLVEIEPLPLSSLAIGSATQGGFLRPVSVTFRVMDSSRMRLQLGYNARGFKEVNILRRGMQDSFSGDIKFRVLGWSKSADRSHWQIVQDSLDKFCLLSVMSEVMVQY